jgi:hypothetical protein
MSDVAEIFTGMTKGYAKLVAQNFDTVQECYSTEFPAGLSERLTEGQQMAQEKHEGQGTSFDFGGELFQIWSGGSKGNRWVIEDDDLQFHFRTDIAGWNVTVRYLSPGLWEHGITRLRGRVNDLLTSEGLKINGVSLSRVDFAMDFHCPEFSLEQLPGLIAGNLVLTSGVKAGIVFNSKRNETITIGMKKTGVQIQVYDKGQELIDKPGKEWMYDIWEGYGYSGMFRDVDKDGKPVLRARDVWRVEIRLGGEFLKDRNVRTWEEFWPVYTQLLTEALMRRRLVCPKIRGVKIQRKKGHKERWDLHPLWAIAFHFAGHAKEYVPRGRMVTMARDAYIDMLEKQQAGVGRSLSVARTGGYDEEQAREDAERSVEIAVKDFRHEHKVEKAMMRQQWLDDAK